jgi:hypothetical protein
MQDKVRLDGEKLGKSFGATFKDSVKPVLVRLQKDFAGCV